MKNSKLKIYLFGIFLAFLATFSIAGGKEYVECGVYDLHGDTLHFRWMYDSTKDKFSSYFSNDLEDHVNLPKYTVNENNELQHVPIKINGFVYTLTRSAKGLPTTWTLSPNNLHLNADSLNCITSNSPITEMVAPKGHKEHN